MGAEVDYEALAQKLVTQTANIKEGDLVLITGVCAISNCWRILPSMFGN